MATLSTLQTYLTATQRLLHDANFKFWSQTALIDAVNSACNRVVGDSSCHRRLQTVYLSAGLELYGRGMVSGGLVTNQGTLYTAVPAVTIAPPPAGGTTATATCIVQNQKVAQIRVTDGGSGYVTAPAITIAAPGGGGVTATATSSIIAPDTLDVLNVTVFWGSEAYILQRRAYTFLQATYRSWTGYSMRPGLIAKYGQDQWYIGPIPDQFYRSEWDSIISPPDLVNLTDPSVILYPFSECVPYYAAHVAKYQEQSYAEAEKFLEIYAGKMRYARRSIMSRMIPSVYQ